MRAALLPVVLLVACSDPAGRDADPSADDGGGSDAAPAIDASTPVDSAPVVDAPADTTHGGDAGDAGDASKACAAKLCEGFEDQDDGAPPNPKIWTKVGSKGTLAVSTNHAHSGSKSLRILSPSGSYETYVKETVTFPAAKNSFWGRLWFRFESAMPADFVHWNLIEARGPTSNNRVRYGGINNPHGGAFFTNAFLFNVETQGMGEKAIDDDPKPEVPAKTWICVEWMFAGEAGKNEARLFWNGVERPKVHAEDAWFETKYVMPTFDALYLGWAIYQPITKPYEVYIDDVAVGDARVGCD